MEYKYPEGIEVIVKNTDSIKNNNIFYQHCSDNCVPRGNFYSGNRAILKHHNTDNPRFVYYLDFSNGYVSDWFSEKEIEHIAGGEENLVHPLADILEEKTKPPLGVIPIYYYERTRIYDLSRALYEYINSGIEDWKLLSMWANELRDRINTLKEN